MKNIPISAMIGLFFTSVYFIMAVFAPWLAPYGMAEIVGDVWEPSSSEFLLGTDAFACGCADSGCDGVVKRGSDEEYVRRWAVYDVGAPKKRRKKRSEL